MNVEQKVNIHNRFDVHIDNIETGEHRELVGYNIILDGMWTRLCNGDEYFRFIHFGTGTGTPTPERNSLFSPLGSRSAVTEEIIKALPVSSCKRKIVLNPDEFVGQTITEVGIAWGAGNSTLVTHAMLKDAEGNPISFTKTSTDIVTIYATLFASLVDNPLVKLINLPTGNRLLNYLNGGSSFTSGSFNLLPGEGYGPKLGSASASWTADIPNKKRKSKVARFGTNTGNGHVMGLELADLFRVAFPATGIFEGQHYTNVPIGTGDGVTTKFSIPSKNIDSSTLVVKVDGSATTVTQEKRVTYNFDVPGFGTLGQYVSGRDVCFSRDGKVVGIAHKYSPYFRVYDVSSIFDLSSSTPVERSFSVAPTANNYGRSIAMNEDGSHLFLSSDTEPFLRGYEYVGGTYVPTTVPDFTDGPGKIAVSLNGNVLAIGAIDGNTIKVFNKVDGAWIARPDITYNASSTQLKSLDMSDDGTVVVISSTKGIDVYVWIDGAWIRRPDLPSVEKVTTVDCSSDGNTIAYIGTDYNIFVCTWDGSTWVKDAEIGYASVYNNPNNVNNIFMSKNANSIVILASEGPSFFSKRLDGTWDTIGQFGDRYGYSYVGFPPDGSFVAAIVDYYLYLHDFKPRTTEVVFDSAPAEGAAITADYKVKGVHKTDQYVIDVSCAVQFGEGGTENEAW